MTSTESELGAHLVLSLDRARFGRALTGDRIGTAAGLSTGEQEWERVAVDFVNEDGVDVRIDFDWERTAPPVQGVKQRNVDDDHDNPWVMAIDRPADLREDRRIKGAR